MTAELKVQKTGADEHNPRSGRQGEKSEGRGGKKAGISSSNPKRLYSHVSSSANPSRNSFARSRAALRSTNEFDLTSPLILVFIALRETIK